MIILKMLPKKTGPFADLPDFGDAWTVLPLTPLGGPDFHSMWAYHAIRQAQPD